MLEKSEFHRVMREVIMAELASEIDIFDLEGTSIINELYNTNSIASKKGTAEFAFAEEATGILEFITLLAATFKTVLTVGTYVKDTLGRPDSEKIADDLTHELIRQHIPKGKAEKLAKCVAAKMKV
jgi:hypothetical protein